jgi:glycosyltransferase involved in cell wall biosynthesis
VPGVTPHLDRAAVVVAPLRLGGGLRVKVLEALAAGKPVVATPLAAAGLDVADGAEIILAESAEAFGAAVGRLLIDPARRVALAARAREWAIANISPERCAEGYEALYDELTVEPAAARAR